MKPYGVTFTPSSAFAAGAGAATGAGAGAGVGAGAAAGADSAGFAGSAVCATPVSGNDKARAAAASFLSTFMRFPPAIFGARVCPGQSDGPDGGAHFLAHRSDRRAHKNRRNAANFARKRVGWGAQQWRKVSDVQGDASPSPGGGISGRRKEG